LPPYTSIVWQGRDKALLVCDHTYRQSTVQVRKNHHHFRHYVTVIIRLQSDLQFQITYEQLPSPKIPRTSRDFETFSSSSAAEPSAKSFKSERETYIESTLNDLSKRGIIAKKGVAHTIGERKILQKGVESPFLVGLKFSFQTERDLYLVFWHLRRETKFPEERAKFYVAELILALEHLHKYDIV